MSHEQANQTTGGAQIVRAMDAGALPDLETKYGTVREAEEFSYSKGTQPAVVFKPKTYKKQ